MKVRMASVRSRTEAKVSRRMAWRVLMPKKTSTRLLRWDVFLGLDAPDRLLVDEQQPLEQAVVAHEVFRWWQGRWRVGLGRWRGPRGIVAVAAGGQQKTSRCQR